MTNNAGITIVTGGASGIGLATAAWLLARGRSVLVLDYSESNLESARAALKEYEGGAAFAVLDVTDEEQMLQVLSTNVPAGTAVSGLVNSAGFGTDIPFLETTSKTLRDMLEVNLVGTFAISREVARRMVGTGGGSIVHISSVSGLIGNKGRSAYGATKAALVNLTQVMSNELARHDIRVNCVCPGPIETPLAAQAHGNAGKVLWEQQVPMKRYGSPKEIANTVGFLLDEESSSYVTGQIISVDGGFIAAGLLLNSSLELPINWNNMPIYNLGEARPEIHESAYVADAAILIGRVTLAPHSSVWSNAVLRADNEPITIGEGSNVQEGAVLHCDPGFPLSIGKNVTIGHQAMLHGCTVGDGSLIGIQVVLLNGVVIGKNCLVGAGAVVTENKTFPDNSLILGAPAKVVRTLTPEAVEGIAAGAREYAQKSARFKSELELVG